MAGKVGIKIFISHTHAEKKIALALHHMIRKVSDVFRPWCSSDTRARGGISFENWRRKIGKELNDADLLIAIFTPESRDRSWITFEAAYMLGEGKPFVPLYHYMKSDALPSPFRGEQAFDGEDHEHLLTLCRRLYVEQAGLETDARKERSWSLHIKRYLEKVQDHKLDRRRDAMFHGDFHSASGAKLLKGDWWAKWTVFEDGDRSRQTVYGTVHPVRIYSTRWRIRLVGEADQEQDRLYPCEGVVSPVGDVALSYWSDTGSNVCGTVLLKNHHNNALVGTWQGFSALQLRGRESELKFVEGRAILARERADIGLY